MKKKIIHEAICLGAFWAVLIIIFLAFAIMPTRFLTAPHDEFVFMNFVVMIILGGVTSLVFIAAGIEVKEENDHK